MGSSLSSSSSVCSFSDPLSCLTGAYFDLRNPVIRVLRPSSRASGSLSSSVELSHS